MLALICLSLPAGSLTAATQTRASTEADGFRICNRSGQEVEIATAIDLVDQGGTLLSRGWFVFDDGQCSVFWPGALQHRYFYVYAQNKQAGREWKGDVPVCVSRAPFELSAPRCGADQYSRPFVRIDTAGSVSWTYTLLP
jgi:uncharacterized membrane protein